MPAEYTKSYPCMNTFYRPQRLDTADFEQLEQRLCRAALQRLPSPRHPPETHTDLEAIASLEAALAEEHVRQQHREQQLLVAAEQLRAEREAFAIRQVRGVTVPKMQETDISSSK